MKQIIIVLATILMSPSLMADIYLSGGESIFIGGEVVRCDSDGQSTIVWECTLTDSLGFNRFTGIDRDKKRALNIAINKCFDEWESTGNQQSFCVTESSHICLEL